MRQAVWLALALAILNTSACDSAKRSQETTQPTATPKEQPKSKLYESFDVNKLSEKYAAHFPLSNRGTISWGVNLTFTPDGDFFKLFRIYGDIADEELKKVLHSLRTELSDLAKANGVKVVQEPKETVANRPIALLMVLFLGETVELTTVQGFYFTYQQDKIAGAVDVFAARCVAGDRDEKQWKIVCAVHEPVR